MRVLLFTLFLLQTVCFSSSKCLNSVEIREKVVVFTVGQQPEGMQTGGGLISDIGFSLSSYKIGMQNRQTMTGEFKKSHEV